MLLTQSNWIRGLYSAGCGGCGVINLLLESHGVRVFFLVWRGRPSSSQQHVAVVLCGVVFQNVFGYSTRTVLIVSLDCFIYPKRFRRRPTLSR